MTSRVENTSRIEFRSANELVLQTGQYTISNLVDKVIEIQKTIYEPDLVEPRTIFEHILNNWPNLCLFALVDNKIVGHLIAHSWHTNSYPPRLNSVDDILGIASTHENTIPEILFIHDLTIHPEKKNQGLGSRLYNSFQEQITNLALKPEQHHQRQEQLPNTIPNTIPSIIPSINLCLVSVQGSSTFWKKQGFYTQTNICPPPHINTNTNSLISNSNLELENIQIHDVLGSYGCNTAIFMTKIINLT